MSDAMPPHDPDDEPSGAVIDHAPAALADRLRAAARRGLHRVLDRIDQVGAMPLEGWLTLGVVFAAMLFVLAQMQPQLLGSNSTPNGGDMGAHVWGPMYLREHLIPNGRLTGWTPDWYGGFPAYHFYMVMPSLFILALDTVLPYGMAFKWVTVAGLITLPLAAYALGRLGGQRFPAPALMAVAGAAFVFDQSFSIYGGNIASTLAGEFAFSISLSFAVVFLAVFARGLDTGRHRGAAAALLALTGLCHLIPAFFAIVGAAVLYVLRVGTCIGEALLAKRGRVGWWPLLSAAVLAGAWVNIVQLGWLPEGWLLAVTAGTSLVAGVVALGAHLAGEALDAIAAPTRFASDGSTSGALDTAFVVDALEHEAIEHEALPGAEPEAIEHGGLDASADAVLVTAGAAAVAGGAATAAAGAEPGAESEAESEAESGAGDRFTAQDALDVGDLPARRADVWDRVRPRQWWVLCVAVVGGLLSMWWVLPFYGRQAYLNDMGWQKIGLDQTTGELRWNCSAYADGSCLANISDSLFQRQHLSGDTLVDYPSISIVLALAGFGFVAALLFRDRVGMFLGVLVVCTSLAFAYAPDGRLWNARLLPFHYLTLDLLAAVGAAEIIRSVAILFARDPRRPVRWITAVATPAVVLAVAVYVMLPLRALGPLGAHDTDGSYDLALPLPGFLSDLGRPDAGGKARLWIAGMKQGAFVTGWAKWNYKGYEEKPAYPEYRDLLLTMDRLGKTRGCGMSMWEYRKDPLEGYGTPMALMLLPFWTDSCIGSMEGLYFEASSSTPFHFINQDELSQGPSNAQSHLPYGAGGPTAEDFDLGIRHLQMYGVRYYLAVSAEMISFGRAHPELTELESSGPWVIFEVAGAATVAPLRNEPAVVTDVADDIHHWLQPAVAWYKDPDRWDVYLASSGPDAWQRVADVDPGELPENYRAEPKARALPPVEVSDIRVSDDGISFDVDRVGVPVLVRMSYFPNWKADGADGPYRVMPNLMVVVPTERHVEMRYGWTGLDLFAWLLSAVGVGLFVLLLRRPAVAVPAAPSRGGGDAAARADEEPAGPYGVAVQEADLAWITEIDEATPT